MNGRDADGAFLCFHEETIRIADIRFEIDEGPPLAEYAGHFLQPADVPAFVRPVLESESPLHASLLSIPLSGSSAGISLPHLGGVGNGRAETCGAPSAGR